MILAGMPNRRYTLSWMIFAVPIESVVLKPGAKITPFVESWSPMTQIESYRSFPDGGRSVIQSMVMQENGVAGC